MSRARLKFFPGLAATIALAACSTVPYSPRPLDIDATAVRISAPAPAMPMA